MLRFVQFASVETFIDNNQQFSARFFNKLDLTLLNNSSIWTKALKFPLAFVNAHTMSAPRVGQLPKVILNLIQLGEIK